MEAAEKNTKIIERKREEHEKKEERQSSPDMSSCTKSGKEEAGEKEKVSEFTDPREKCATTAIPTCYYCWCYKKALSTIAVQH